MPYVEKKYKVKVFPHGEKVQALEDIRFQIIAPNGLPYGNKFARKPSGIFFELSKLGLEEYGNLEKETEMELEIKYLRF